MYEEQTQPRKLFAPMSDYEIRKLQGKSYKVSW